VRSNNICLPALLLVPSVNSVSNNLLSHHSLRLFFTQHFMAPSVSISIMANTFVKLVIAMIISAGLTLVRAESHIIRFNNR
jgi:hypothetical protein